MSAGIPCQLPLVHFLTRRLLIMSGLSSSQSSKNIVLEILTHSLVCGSNLDTLRRGFPSAWASLQMREVTAGNGITQMAIIGFDDASYIELIAPIKPGVVAGSAMGEVHVGRRRHLRVGGRNERLTAGVDRPEEDRRAGQGSRTRQSQAAGWHVGRVDDRRCWLLDARIDIALYH